MNQKKKKLKTSSSDAKQNLRINSKSFNKEKLELEKQGIASWESIKNLSNKDIQELIIKRHLSNRNLNCLRCIAIFICDLNLLQEEAALLIHSGIASIDSLAKLTPTEVYSRTKRLEILLGIIPTSISSLSKANKWIQKAKDFQKSY